jgi:hypothetical protein
MENTQAKAPIEEPVVITPPVINSIGHDINKIMQPDLLGLFDEELAADGSVRFNGKFSSRNEFGLTSTLTFDNKQGPQFNPCDEVSIVFRPEQNVSTHKFSIKGNKLSLHSDFGTQVLKMSVGENNFDSWFNPYLSIDTNRLLNKPFFSIGAYSVTPNFGAKNSKITFYQSRQSIQADIVSNSSTTFGNYFINSLIASSLYTPFSTNKRVVLLGADYGDAVAALKLEKNTPGSYLDWNMDIWSAMLAYTASAKHTIGVEVFKNQFIKSHLRVFLAYQFRHSGNFRLKGKVDNDFNTQLFSEFLVGSSLKVQLAAKSNLANLKRSGVLRNLPAVGVQLSLNG